MDYHKSVSTIFNYFYYKIYKNAGYQLDLSVNKQGIQVDNFIKLLAKHYNLASVGNNFLIDYFSFVFHYWSDKKTKRNISLGWVIGKKTFQRWLDRSDSYQYFYGKFLYEYDINVDQLRQKLFENEAVAAGLDPAEELEKKRFSGDARLYHCLISTTMYNHKSETCLLCVHKSSCKKILKINLPLIYKKRGYE